ncbi:MAG: GNAT family N-acetyltransferase [Deltaproteobacteria bacterium]|nr:GNAT family N-acetyltransferase [Deltaproteobacteria bacterium]
MPPVPSVSQVHGLRAAILTEDADVTALIEALARACDDTLGGLERGGEAIPAAHALLEVLRHSVVLRAVQGDTRWEDRLLQLIRRSDYTLHNLIAQRVALHPDKVLFRVLVGSEERTLDWAETSRRVDEVARALIAALDRLGKPDGKIAFALNNSLDMALADLACLSAGLFNVIIPANAPAEHIAMILESTEAPLMLVADDQVLSRVKSVQGRTRALQQLVIFRGRSAAHDVMTLDELIAGGAEVEEGALAGRRAGIRADQVTTAMFTSGTTGLPKGILFSHTNMIFKRYARALALPELGEGDRFLSYLPLFHTFGRFFELMGSLFWSASYTFAESPSIQMLVSGMRRVRPTVFISVPRKWEQLYELITSQLDPAVASEESLQMELRLLTGGALRWGLSAAGYLSPEVFGFFQRHGVELMSGFGMTEATGGITMTPPGRYRPRSLGGALPGVELRLGEDGELFIRGPYVTSGYFGVSDEDSPIRDGWYATGDIMRQDEDGFIEIVDRKKDIYKNSQGETISPQRVEHILTEFDAVEQAFLVGDHRAHNTLLLYPAWAVEGELLAEMDDKERRAYFSSLVVSANAFLMPHERVLDFRLLERPLSVERGELTPKGTFKRRVVEENYSAVIEEMYVQGFSSVRWDRLEVRIPNWFYRESGCLSGDIVASEGGLEITKLDRRLRLEPVEDRPHQLRVGDYVYNLHQGRVDLHRLLTDPLNWLGNYELFAFAQRALEGWYRPNRPKSTVCFACQVDPRPVPPALQTAFAAIVQAGERSLQGLHLAMLHLQSPIQQHGLAAVHYLENIARRRECMYRDLALECLFRPALTRRRAVRHEMLRVALRYVPVQRFQGLLSVFATLDGALLDEERVGWVAEVCRTEAHVAAIEAVLDEAQGEHRTAYEVRTSVLPALFDLLVACGLEHPELFRRAREAVVRFHLQAESNAVAALAVAAGARLQAGCRGWFAGRALAAVDSDTGDAYGWEEVVAFDGGIAPEDQLRLLTALQQSSALAESIFLLFGGARVELTDLSRGGVWVSHLGSGPERAVYRVRTQTRDGRAFDLVFNLILVLSDSEIHEEVDWLIAAGASHGRGTLVGALGGWWPEHRIWTEEYAAGESVARFLRRMSRKRDPAVTERLRSLWPFFVWSAAEVYVGLLTRTGLSLQLASPSPRHLVSPRHDYLGGTKVVSLSDRTPFRAYGHFFCGLYRSFVLETEREYPELAQGSMWPFVFSAVIDSEGEEAGVALLHRLRDEGDDAALVEGVPPLQEALAAFLAGLEGMGAVPKGLYFARRRYQRWLGRSEGPTLKDYAEVAEELLETYALREQEVRFPGTRTRFFLETVFADSSPEVRGALEQLVARQRADRLTADEVLAALSGIQERYPLSDRDAYFLARISYPHVQPQDEATLLRLFSDGARTADLVVRFEDADGRPFFVRRPVSAREVAALHQLYFKANLPVEFDAHHRFLVAISDRGYLIGGLFHTPPEEGEVNLEKLVVADAFRRVGVGEALMREFLMRMRDQGVERVTAGFFRPEYFYRLGFRLGARHGGLACDLREVTMRPR